MFIIHIRRPAMKKFLITAVILLLFTGCVQMQVNTAADDADAKAKSMNPPKGKALVYFIRDTYIGKPFAHEITKDGTKIGSTCGYYYIYTIVSPGKHKFISKGDFDGTLELSAEAGKTYYVQQKILPGVWTGGTSLELLKDSDGKTRLAQCKLSADNSPGN